MQRKPTESERELYRRIKEQESKGRRNRNKLSISLEGVTLEKGICIDYRFGGSTICSVEVSEGAGSARYEFRGQGRSRMLETQESDSNISVTPYGKIGKPRTSARSTSYGVRGKERTPGSTYKSIGNI